MSFSFRVIWLGTNLNNFCLLSARWNSQFFAELPWNLVRIQNNYKGFSLIDVHQNATLPDSFEGSSSHVSGNCCNLALVQCHLIQSFWQERLLCALFCDKNRNLAHNHSCLLQTKLKAVDKTLEQHFLKDFKATCENYWESELKQQKAIWNVITCVCRYALGP